MLPIYPLNSEQIEIQNLALEFANREIVPLKNLHGGQTPDNVSLSEKVAGSGLINTRIPTELGGLGLSLLDTSLIIEQLSYVCGGTASLAEASELAITYLLIAGNIEQKKHFLEPLAQEGCLAGIAPPNWGNQSGKDKLMAIEQAGEFILNGSCEPVLNAQIAKWFIVPCSLADGVNKNRAHDAQRAYFIVSKDIPGLTLSKRVTYMGCKAADLWTVDFENVCLQPLAKIAASDELIIANSAIISSMCLGMANAAFNEAKKYSQERNTFGMPIAKHQIISFMLADIYTDINAQRLMIYDTIASINNGKTKLALSTQAFAMETTSALVIDALQILGGYGYVQDYPLAKIMQDTKTHQLFFSARNTNSFLSAQLFSQ